MILNRLESAERLERLHPGFAAAFAFLRRADLDQLTAGRHEIDGPRLCAVVIRGQGRGKGGVKLEVHRRYIDIQYSVTDPDLIGWKPTRYCGNPEQPFNEAKDVQLFLDTPDSWVTIPAGCFGIFFPEDAHAPQAAEGAIHKVVVKVSVGWKE
jgi:YhcH/YjgK/YiaL family protein